jgi:hypothetical protein
MSVSQKQLIFWQQNFLGTKVVAVSVSVIAAHYFIFQTVEFNPPE